MSQTINEAGFGVIKVPGSYVQTKVIDNQAGTLSTGVIALIGEADLGPDFTQETDLPSYGPDEFSAVQLKYGSGPLVDAFFRATVASNDPLITNTFTRAIIVKTNPSSRASNSLLRAGLANYSVIASKNYGALENQIAVQVITETEFAPTTGLFSYVPAGDDFKLSARVNGGAKSTVTVSANTAVSSLAALLQTNIPKTLVKGGLNRGTLSATMSSDLISLTPASPGSLQVTFTLGGAATWAVTPSVGDTLVLPDNNDYSLTPASTLLGVPLDANRGTYIVTGATSNTITAIKVRDYDSSSVTAPTQVINSLVTHVNTIVCYSPLEMKVMDGVNRGVLSGLTGKDISTSVSNSTITITLETGSVWAALPQAGDWLQFPDAHSLAGWYQVTGATSGTAANASTIVATRLSDGAVTGTGAAPISPTNTFTVLKPALDGIGKALELYDGGGTEALSTLPLKFMALAPNTNVSWISTALAPKLLTSATESFTTISAVRSSSAISEDTTAGGDIVLSVGYKGNGLATTGTLTISGTTLTTSVVGGNGQALNVNLTQFGTIGDLVAYLNAQPGYVAQAASNAIAAKPLNYTLSTGSKATILDKGTWSIASELGAAPGRIKKDAYAFWEAVSGDMTLVQLGLTSAAASAGLPETQALFFLTNGGRGATSNSTIQAALVQLERSTLNFIVPLFSRDASVDSAQGLTDLSSSYTIAQIHDLVKTHILLMSQVKRRKWRQAFLSIKGSFTQARSAASSVASARASMTFQDVITTSAAGESVQYQPWMAAVLAASMQAGGFNEPIVKKAVNVSGVLMADGSYGDSISEQENALDAGLLPLELAAGVGVRWVSDQTTYTTDTNFVYNSIQAMYMVDVLAALIAFRMERKFVGRPLSQVPAAVMRTFLEAIMREALALGVTCPSDGAPQGYKDASIEIRAPAAYVKVTASLDSGLYFVLTTAFITKVTSAA